MPKISVIIPVYNIYDYLEECLESVVKQTFDDFEVLVVNDGSLDNSQEIIDCYAKKYSFVHGLKKKNGGLSSARNYGLKKAQADYVYFLDGDDFIAPDLLEKCYQKIVETKTDIVYFDFYEYYSSFDMKVHLGVKDVLGSEKERYMVSPPAAWNKVFRKSLFLEHDIFFPEGLWYEDLATTPRILFFANKIEYVKEPLYYYRQREGSIMNTVNPKIFQMYDILDLLLHFFENQKSVTEYYDVLTILALLNLIFVIRTLANSNMEDRYKKQLEAITYLEEHYPDWRGNSFYKQEKWITRVHIRILMQKNLLKIYNKVRGNK